MYSLRRTILKKVLQSTLSEHANERPSTNDDEKGGFIERNRKWACPRPMSRWPWLPETTLKWVYSRPHFIAPPKQKIYDVRKPLRLQTFLISLIRPIAGQPSSIGRKESWRETNEFKMNDLPTFLSVSTAPRTFVDARRKRETLPTERENLQRGHNWSLFFDLEEADNRSQIKRSPRFTHSFSKRDFINAFQW